MFVFACKNLNNKLITCAKHSIKNTYNSIDRIVKINIVPGCKVISLVTLVSLYFNFKTQSIKNT